eukprot:jgi/Chrpa1/447/Chrysochromulina_OHIO_Genome00011225-RA
MWFQDKHQHHKFCLADESAVCFHQAEAARKIHVLGILRLADDRQCESDFFDETQHLIKVKIGGALT